MYSACKGSVMKQEPPGTLCVPGVLHVREAQRMAAALMYSSAQKSGATSVKTDAPASPAMPMVRLMMATTSLRVMVASGLKEPSS